MSDIIKPTVGRIVWLCPKGHQRTLLQVSDDSQPVAAIVTRVWNDRMVNITAFSQNSGDPVPLASVRLLQGDGRDGALGVEETFAQWMPYQKGQAAKSEDLDSQYQRANIDLMRAQADKTAAEADQIRESVRLMRAQREALYGLAGHSKNAEVPAADVLAEAAARG